MRFRTHTNIANQQPRQGGRRQRSLADRMADAYVEAGKLRESGTRPGWSLWTVSSTPAGVQVVTRLLGSQFAVMPYHGRWVAGRWHEGHGRIQGTILRLCPDLLTAQMTCEKAARDVAARQLTAA